MGWTGYPIRRQQVTTAWIRRFFTERYQEWQVLDMARGADGVWYLAVKRTPDEPPFAIVCLTRYADGMWWYKDMSEHEGPFYCACPERILRLLGPIDSEWALRWRADCRKRLEIERRIAQFVQPGVWLTWDEDKAPVYPGWGRFTRLLVTSKRPLRLRTPGGMGVRLHRETLRLAREVCAPATACETLMPEGLSHDDHSRGVSRGYAGAR